MRLCCISSACELEHTGYAAIPLIEDPQMDNGLKLSFCIKNWLGLYGKVIYRLFLLSDML